MTIKDHKICLPSGLVFDFTNMWGEERLNETDITAAKDKIAQAVTNVDKMRSTGIVEGHLSKDGTPEHVYFTRLPFLKKDYPNTEELITGLMSYGRKVRQECDAVIFCGIGGSYLGGKVLYDCYTSEYWERQIDPDSRLSKVYFSGNNVDPEDMESIWDQIEVLLESTQANSGKKLKVELVVISKSGTTLESTAGFLYFYEKMQEKKDAIKTFVTVVTDKHNQAGPLNILADKHGWNMFDIVEGIGGRFSVLSTPGLIVGAVLGMDLLALLQGARDMDESCKDSDLAKNPALANSVYKYLASEKYGCHIEVMMPYSFTLLSLGNWYVQLLAESLGKRKNRQGEDIFYGRTPLVAVGTTDMHAQTQLHQEGRRDKAVQFIALDNAEGKIVLNNPFPEIKAFAKFDGLDMQKALLVALHANAEALSSDNRFNACYYVPKLNEYILGQLFYYLMLSIAYEGELAEVDAYDQPGVEIYKRIMNKNL